MKKLLSRSLSIAAFCAALSPMLSTARADYSVVVDCHGRGGLPEWSYTTSRITAWAKIDGFWNNLGTRSVPASLCATDWGLSFDSSGFSAAKVQQIAISINDSDTFWVDQIRVEDSHGVTMWFGTDNNRGYCVSTDPDDGFNSYCPVAARQTYHWPEND